VPVREISAETLAGRISAFQLDRIDLAVVLEEEDGGIVVGGEPFDSQAFGLKIARILSLWAPSSASYRALLSAVTDRVAARGYEQVICRTRADALDQIWALEATGFELMDIGVTFGRPVTKVIEAPTYADLVVRPSTDADIAAIVTQMLDQPWGSRYEADPQYAPECVRDLRAQWLWNSHRGRAAVIWIGVMDGQAAGYVTCLLDDKTGHGEIELVGTLPLFRGRRVAARLLEHAVSWFSTRATLVTVRTQATNVAAANLYEQGGFRLHSSDLTFRLSVPGKQSHA
jgi:GNAT superfamily N-acetyltransferase